MATATATKQAKEANVIGHRIVTVVLRGISPYSQSNFRTSVRHKGKEAENETSDQFELRTYKEQIHTNDKGEVIIPAMQLKKALDAGASFQNEKIEGEGQRKWARVFIASVYVDPSPVLTYQKNGKFAPATPDDAVQEWIMAEAQGGRRGGGLRVHRLFPTFSAGWRAEVTYHILSTKITESAFRRMVEAAGMFVGLGRFRPANGGYYGRYEIEKVNW